MIAKTLGIIALGTLAAGGGTLAVANSAASSVSSPAPVAQEVRDVQEPTYTGSISIDSAKYEGVKEQDESKALAGLAKITADQASKQLKLTLVA